MDSSGHIRRKRIWIVALSNLYRFKHPFDYRIKNKTNMGNYNKPKDKDVGAFFGLKWERKGATYCEETASFPLFCGNDYGLAEGMDRIKRVGNGQVPAVVELAWKMLSI